MRSSGSSNPSHPAATHAVRNARAQHLAPAPSPRAPPVPDGPPDAPPAPDRPPIATTAASQRTRRGTPANGGHRRALAAAMVVGAALAGLTVAPASEPEAPSPHDDHPGRRRHHARTDRLPRVRRLRAANALRGGGGGDQHDARGPHPRGQAQAQAAGRVAEAYATAGRSLRAPSAPAPLAETATAIRSRIAQNRARLRRARSSRAQRTRRRIRHGVARHETRRGRARRAAEEARSDRRSHENLSATPRCTRRAMCRPSTASERAGPTPTHLSRPGGARVTGGRHRAGSSRRHRERGPRLRARPGR